MARAELGLIFATPNNGDAYAGAYENANFTVEQAQSMLEDNDDIPFPEYKDIYEQALQNNPEEFAQNFSIIDKMRDDAEVTATNRIDNDGNEHFVSVFRNAFGVGLNFAVTEGSSNKGTAFKYLIQFQRIRHRISVMKNSNIGSLNLL